jgi:hypothetical protein
MKSEYDLYSAVTFLLVGLGIGSVLAIVFNPAQRVAPDGINSWRTAGTQPPAAEMQPPAKERIA